MTKVTILPSGLESLRLDPRVRAELLRLSDPIVERAQQAAPRLTGEGAASIHAEAVLDGQSWEAHISWDREHYYMGMHESGTVKLPAMPFLVPSLTEGAVR